MSYDVSLIISTGTEFVEVFSANHTSNTSDMWRAAGCDIAAFDGKPAPELAAACEKAIRLIESDRKAFEQFQPSNRWGTIDSTLGFLHDLMCAGRLHEKTVVSVCR